MTKDGLNEQLMGALSRTGINEISLEIRKTRIGAALVAVNVIGVCEFSDTLVVMLSHSGRITVRGERLCLSVFEDKSVEILGKICGVEMDYAKAR